jgi:hypothetical protein
MRSIAPDFANEAPEASPIFSRFERSNAGAATADDIREAQAPFRQPPIVPICEGFGNQSGLVQEFPKSIGMARKMMAGKGRTQPRVDADEEDPYVWLHVIRETAKHGAALFHRLEAV